MPGSAEPPAAGRAAAGEAPGSWRRRWGRVGGPLLTLGTITTLEFVSRTEFPISASAAVYLIAVAFVTHTFGLASGLVSAAVTVGYAAYFFSTPGLVPDYTRDNLLRVLLLAVTTPATAVLVGLLRRQADSGAGAAAQRAQEATASQAALEVRTARLRTLASLNRTVSSTLATDEALTGISRAAAELMRVPMVCIWVADEEGRRLEARGFSDQRFGDFPLKMLGIGQGAAGWVATRRHALEVDDVFTDGRFLTLDWWRAHGLSSFQGVPIVHEGTLLGVLALHGRAPFRFGPDDRDLLDIFVAQVAVAIRNARVYAESALHAARLETLTRLTRTITASLDPDAILRAVAEAALPLFPGGACRLWIVEGDRIRLRAEAGITGDDGGQRELRLGEGLPGAVCGTGRSVVLEDVSAQPGLPDEPWLRAQGFVSCAALPLSAMQRVIGALVLFTRQRRVFSVQELGVLGAFTEQAAVALDKARLFQDTQERRRLSERLYALAMAMERSVDLRSRLDDFVAGARDALGFDRCNVMLATADGTALELVAGTDHAPARRLMPVAGAGGCRVAWESGETLIVGSDAQLAALPPVAPELRDHPVLRTRRFAVVPLTFRGQPVGLVAADNKRSRRPITTRGVAQLQLFCQQLAQSISSARLYAETQRREREARILFEVTRRLSATLDAEEILDIVTDGTIEALRCDAAGFYHWDPGREGLLFARGRNLDPAARRGLTLAPGEGVVGRAYAERRPVWTDDRQADPAVAYSAATARVLESARSPRALLAVPVVIRDHVFGVLVGHHLEPHEWAEHEVSLLASLAPQAAVALEKARLYTETQQNLAGAALLNEAARTLHRALDVHRLLPDTVASVGQTFGAVGAGVILFDASPRTRPERVIRWGACMEESVRLLAAPLRRREQPLLIADTAAHADTIPRELLPAERTAVAAFPVRGRSHVLAGLVLLFPAPRPLSEAETRLLAAYADQLAMALDNAALFEEAENKKTQLEQVFASTSDGFLVTDLEGRVVALNRQAGDLLGILPDEMVGRPYGRLLEKATIRWDAPAGQALAAALAGTPDSRAGDLEVRFPVPRTLRWQAVPTRDLLGGTVGVTVTLRDVTREREIDRMKTDFVSTVSHELRTPLTSVKGSLHLLLSDSSLAVDEVQRQLLDISLKNTDRLIRLINNILDVSKIEAGQIRLALATHRVTDFVSAAVEGIASFAEARAIAIDRVIPEELPGVTVDFDRMVQVVTNLLSNAVKFSPPGRRVAVSAALAAGEIAISVTDQGRGIAPQDVPRLFQKFQQLDGSSVREVGGTGLGLAICRGIVEEHGGRITVASQPGAGATFTVWLPRPAAEAAARPVLEPAEAPGDGPLILVVDDEPDLREAIREQLEMGGFRVVEAGRALEAIEVARDRRPDLITMDLMMSDLDGLEAVRLLREYAETRETPVVMVTAIEMDASRFGPLGPTAYLTKPFSQRDLLATIRSHLPAGKGTSSR